MNDMQSLVSLSYLPDTMLCLSFSFSAAVAAADSSSSSSSLHCIQLQLLWRLLFVLHFLLCSSLSLSLSLAPSTHTFFRTVPIFCIFCLLRFLLLLFFDAHTSHWLLFFLSLWPFICPVVVVVAVCIFFAIFSHLLCSVASFVRSAALNFNLPNEHETCVRVCVCRNATGEGGEKEVERGVGDCYQIGCCTLLHFSSAAISNWLGIGLVSS